MVPMDSFGTVGCLTCSVVCRGSNVPSGIFTYRYQFRVQGTHTVTAGSYVGTLRVKKP
jgi:hypothetical protein